MDPIRAAVRPARRARRHWERRRRGRPVRRVEPRTRPSARLRDAWAADPLRRPVRSATPERISPVPVASPPVPVASSPPAAVAPPPAPPVAVVALVETSTAVPLADPAVAPDAPATEAAPPATGPRAPDSPATPASHPPPSTPPPATTDAGAAHGGRRRTLVIAAAVVVVLVVVGVVSYRTTSSSPSRRPVAVASAAAAPDDTALVAWLRANAAQGDVDSTDSALVDRLRAAGVSNAQTAADATAQVGDVVLQRVSAAEVASPQAVSLAGSATRTLVTVAAFIATGQDPVAVAEVVDKPVAQVSSANAATAATARAGGQAILNNAAFTVDPTARPPFEAGTIDLRATAFLVSLAEQSPVHLTAVVVDPAEQAAGTPIRSITVTGVAPAMVQSMAAGARGLFAPVVTVAAGTAGTAGTAIRLTWSIVADTSSLTLR